MTILWRRWWLATALLATAAAATLAPSPRDDGVVVSERVRARQGASVSVVAPAPAAMRERVLAIRVREPAQASASGIFTPRQWVSAVPPPKKNLVVAPTAPPAPVAPPLPFRVLGRYSDDNMMAVFLQHNDQNLVARVGDTIGEYKIENLKDSTLTLRYLPLNQTQTLDVGAGQ